MNWHLFITNIVSGTLMLLFIYLCFYLLFISKFHIIPPAILWTILVPIHLIRKLSLKVTQRGISRGGVWTWSALFHGTVWSLSEVLKEWEQFEDVGLANWVCFGTQLPREQNLISHSSGKTTYFSVCVCSSGWGLSPFFKREVGCDVCGSAWFLTASSPENSVSWSFPYLLHTIFFSWSCHDLHDTNYKP